jgi:hypothetical protein
MTIGIWLVNPKAMDDKISPSTMFTNVRATPKDEDVYSKDDNGDIKEDMKPL